MTDSKMVQNPATAVSATQTTELLTGSLGTGQRQNEPSTEILPGGAPVAVGGITNVDGTTITGDGSLANPLHGGATLPVTTQTPGAGATVNLVGGKLNAINIAAGGNFVLQFPKASSVPNGTLMSVVLYNIPGGGAHYTNTPASGDTLQQVLSGQQAISPGTTYFEETFVSDGGATWWEIV